MQTRWYVWFVFVLACGRSPSNQHKMWDQDRENARSSRVDARSLGAASMRLRCCRPELLDPNGTLGALLYRKEACDELRRLLETETEQAVLEELILVQLERPHCYVRFPPTTAARLCRQGCPDKTRRDLIITLGAFDASAEIVEALLHHLTVPIDNTVLTHADTVMGHQVSPWSITNDDIDLWVALQLADMGEPDLQPVLDALVSSDPRVRRAATRAFSEALANAPLDMPALVPALEKLESDADSETARSARDAARAHRRWAASSPDDLVRSMLQVSGRCGSPNSRGCKRLAIRMLAVRSFSCRTKAAADALVQLSVDPDQNVAAEAKHAIVFRTKRCRLSPSD